MPTIAEYSAPLARDVVRPTSEGIEAYRAAGAEAIRLGSQTHEIESQEAQRLEQTGRELQETLRQTQTFADKAEAHQRYAETGDLLTQGIALQNQFLHNYVADRATHAGDHEWTQNVLNDAQQLYEPLIQQTNDPQVKLRLQEAQGEFAKQMGYRTASDYSTFAGGQIDRNLMTAYSNFGSMVQTDPSPGTINHAISETTKLYGHLLVTPGLTAEHFNELAKGAQNINAKYVNLAVNSLLHPDESSGRQPSPDIAQQTIDQYKNVIGGENANVLTKEVDATRKAMQHDFEHQQTWQREQANSALKHLAGNLETQMIGVDLRGQPTLTVPPGFTQHALSEVAKIHAQYPGVQYDASPVAQTVKFADEVTREHAPGGKMVVSDPTTVAQLMGRMYKDPNDPQAVTQQEAFNLRMEGKISDTDFLRFRQQIQDNASADQGKRLSNKIVDDGLSMARAMLTASDPWSPLATGVGAEYEGNVPNIRGQQAFARYAPWFSEQFQFLTRQNNISAAQAVAQLTDPKVIAKFAWDAGESGQFIKNILPDKQPEQPAVGAEQGGFWSKFMGGISHLFAPSAPDETSGPPR